MRFGWSSKAGRDRDDIFNYISAENFAAAVANDQRIAAVEVQLRRFPESGRTGRVPGTRELVVSGTPFLAIYSVKSETVTVLRVIHGAQSWPPKR